MSESGYTHCACRDCFDVAVSSDVNRPSLCPECKAEGCEPEPDEAVGPGPQYGYDCQRSDAYGTEV